MNYYKARKTASGSGWHYTVKNDGVVVPVGYCTGHGPHDTEEEAQACYKEYLLDRKLRYWLAPDAKRTCEVCGEWTQGRAAVGMRQWALCEEHQTRDVVQVLLPLPGEVWSS